MSQVENVIIEMLSDRNYTNIIRKVNNDANTKLTITFENENSKGVVWWLTDEKIGINHVFHFTQKAINDGYEKFILIIDGSITSAARKELTSTINDLYNSEYFLSKDLQINITKHKYVPKHILLSEKEREEVKKSYRTKLINFPQILESDPVSRYYNFRSGDLIKIERCYNLYTKQIDAKPFEISYRYVIKD